MTDMANTAVAAATAAATVSHRPAAHISAGLKNIYSLECRDEAGALKWAEAVENDIVEKGLDDLLGIYWAGSNYSAAHFIGLTDGAPVIDAADTLAAHPGWAEVTAYDEAGRPALVPGAVAGQSVDNSASPAVYSINAAATIGGMFIATDAAKDGTAGKLIAAGAFSGGDRMIAGGDSLTVTVTLSAANAAAA